MRETGIENQTNLVYRNGQLIITLSRCSPSQLAKIIYTIYYVRWWSYHTSNTNVVSNPSRPKLHLTLSRVTTRWTWMSYIGHHWNMMNFEPKSLTSWHQSTKVKFLHLLLSIGGLKVHNLLQFLEWCTIIPNPYT